MLNIVKRTAAGTGLLIILPTLARLFHWYGPANSHWYTRLLHWLVLPTSWPWVLISQLLLCGCFFCHLRHQPRVIGVLLLLCVTVLCGLGVKTAIKSQVREPLPYVVWQQLPAPQFYQQSHEQRENYLDSILAQKTASVPVGLSGISSGDWKALAGWQKADDRAFPSGHTFFAAFWALSAMALLSARRHSKTQLLLLIWAKLIMLDHLLLNVSWPRDLLAAILLAWGFSMLCGWLAWRFGFNTTPD